jgi:hypothetical protein
VEDEGMTDTNEREAAAQAGRLGPHIPPAIPTPMIVALVSHRAENGSMDTRGVRFIDPVADRELMAAHGWVRDEVRGQANAMRKLVELATACKGEVSLEFNGHRNVYEDEPAEGPIALRFYPDSPVGFYEVRGSSVESVVGKAWAIATGIVVVVENHLEEPTP